MILGCAWYPEHWDESRWPEDVRLMREAGMNMVRVGEFAWSRLEPAEGQYEFEWLERAIALAAENGLRTILGTPTAAPPAWLTQTYPETLAINADGRQATHGARCHFNAGNPKYLELCARIAGEMAKRFGANPHVIGWQIDNEYHRESWGEDTRRAFQAFLEARHGSLDKLNKRWSTAYWSQEYTDWAQIPLPIAWGGHNPGLQLDYKLFITEVYKQYQHVQIEAIRAHAEPRQWITHNFMGWFDLFDHYTISEELDVVAWDNYVGKGHLDFRANGAVHDLTRGFKRMNYYVLETQPGWVNWSGVGNALYPGEVRCMAWHAVGHGADAVSYWQWRSALGGQEQYHGTLVAADGAPRPLYTEVAELGKDFDRVGPLLEGTTPSSQVAVLHSYEDRWAINMQRHHRDFDPVQHLLSYYRPLRDLTHAVDIVSPLAPLEGYKLVVAPHLHLFHNAILAPLGPFMQNGGHLVLGPRSGFKDRYNALLPSRQPSVLAQGLGAHVEEFYALEEPIPVEGRWGEGRAQYWAEWLTSDAKDVDVLMSYGPGQGWLDGKPAVVTRKFGKGRITYVGAWLDEEMMAKLADWLLTVSKVEPAFGEVPDGVEVCRRAAPDGRELFIFINHTDISVQVPIPKPMRDMLTGKVHRTTLAIGPRDVAVGVKEG
ncbi:MAG: Beta-galactosidase BgaA [bacterium ADurb.Bin429]|nr:MAG: Beta-galactosidase BgaA [bacterium ADurb.Bin429]